MNITFLVLAVFRKKIYVSLRSRCLNKNNKLMFDAVIFKSLSEKVNSRLMQCCNCMCALNEDPGLFVIALKSKHVCLRLVINALCKYIIRTL